MVGVAQLVEHLVVAQVAVGSSPITHPIKTNARVLQDTGICFYSIQSNNFACEQFLFKFISLTGKSVCYLVITHCTPPE